MRRLAPLALIFAFLFAPRLNLGVTVHAGLLAVVALAAGLALRRRWGVAAPLAGVTTLFALLAGYHAVVATVFDHDPSFFVAICVSAVVSIAFGWGAARLVERPGARAREVVDELILLAALAILANAVVVLVEYLRPEVKAAIESFLATAEGANVDYATHPFLLRGLAAAGGASLSMAHALGVLLFIFLFVSRRISAAGALFGALPIVISNIFIGRTGLLFGIVFYAALVGVAVARGQRSGRGGIVRSLALLAIVGSLAAYVASESELDPEVASWAFEWLESAQTGRLETGSTDELMAMMFIPENPVHWLTGVGFFDGTAHVYARSDSGYLKTLLAVGGPLGVALYAALLFMLGRLRAISHDYRWLVGPVSASMLLAEVKEPFLYQNYTGRMVFLLAGAALALAGGSQRTLPAEAIAAEPGGRGA